MYSDVQKELQKQLYTNSTITSLLNSIDSHYMIQNNKVCPESWKLENSTINYYENGRDNFSPYDDITFTANCRAYTYTESHLIAETVKSELHEKTLDDFIYTVEFLGGTLRPSDERDNYNTIIDINVRQK